MPRMKSKEAEQLALAKLKEYLEQNMDAVRATRGREVFMFGPEGTNWVGTLGIFSQEVMKRATLKNGWIDRPEDRARVWVRVIVSEDGMARLEEVADWHNL